MKTTDAAARQAQGWLGLVPPGWPSDVAVALMVGAVQLIGTGFAAQGQPERAPLDALGFLLLAAGPLALVARHRRPDAVVAFVAAVTLLYMLLGYPYGPVVLSFIVAVFTAVTGGARLAAWLSAGALYAGHFGLGYLLGGPWAPRLTLTLMVAVAAWMLVLLIVAEVARIGRERMLEAARTRAEEARRRASEERLRIARELHDVLAHNISLINVQAGVALHLMDEQPGQSRTALVAIKQASNDALRELRSVLDALRQVDDEPPRAPAPGLARLEGLVASAEAAAGRGRPGRLPDRAGGADQRDPARRTGRRDGPRRLRRAGPGGAGRRRRRRPHRRAELRRRQRHPRHARAGRRPRRGAGGRAASWRRLQGACPPAAGGIRPAGPGHPRRGAPMIRRGSGNPKGVPR